MQKSFKKQKATKKNKQEIIITNKEHTVLTCMGICMALGAAFGLILSGITEDFSDFTDCAIWGMMVGLIIGFAISEGKIVIEKSSNGDYHLKEVQPTKKKSTKKKK